MDAHQAALEAHKAAHEAAVAKLHRRHALLVLFITDFIPLSFKSIYWDDQPQWASVGKISRME
jgi:hypothetical protein